LGRSRRRSSNQFYVKNNDFTIIPDIVVFVNGIPLAVIECKNPNLQEPIDEAISQLFGYREKNEQFFYPNQMLVALARYRACYASTFAPAKYFFEWKKPYMPGAGFSGDSALLAVFKEEFPGHPQELHCF